MAFLLCFYESGKSVILGSRPTDLDARIRVPKSAPGRGEHVQLHRYFGHGKDRGVQGTHRGVRRRTFSGI